MSQRTIIEINHDYYHRLEANPDWTKTLLDAIRGDDERDWEALRFIGIRKITQRHHSDNGHIQFKHSKVALP